MDQNFLAVRVRLTRHRRSLLLHGGALQKSFPGVSQRHRRISVVLWVHQNCAHSTTFCKGRRFSSSRLRHTARNRRRAQGRRDRYRHGMHRTRYPTSSTRDQCNKLSMVSWHNGVNKRASRNCMLRLGKNRLRRRLGIWRFFLGGERNSGSMSMTRFYRSPMAFRQKKFRLLVTH